MKRKYFISFIFLVLSALTYAQTDTSFWFVAPEISSANNYDRPIYLRLSAYSSAAVVTISQPANSAFGVIQRSIGINQTVSVDLSSYIDSVENKPANTVLNRGLLIRSNVPVSAYYEAANSVNTDIFVLKGKQALGNEFYIPSQNQLANNSTYTPSATSAFDIVAIEDNTVVSITPSQNIVGHSSGVTFNVTLNRGQTYSAVASSQAASGHLIGSKVTSTKPIAITIKDDLLSSFPCSDLQGDQIVPTSVIGTDYVVVKGSLSFNDGVFIVAAKNNTGIYLNGSGTPLTTLNAGGYYYYGLSAAVVNIHSSQPVYVYHNTGTGCEIGGALLPGITCTGSNRVSVIRTTSEPFYVNIVTTNTAKDSFLVNGSSGIINGSSFSAVPGSSTLVYAHIDLSGSLVVGNNNQITNRAGTFHLGVIHGGAATGTRYGYFSGYASLYLGPDIDMCQGDKKTLDAGEGRTSYHWSTGDTTRTIQVTTSGTYWVRTVQNSCTLYDTITITTNPKPTAGFNITSDTIQCFNKNNFTFHNTSSISSGTMSYLWSFGDISTSTLVDPSHTYSVNNLPGGFPVTMIVTGIDGCKDTIRKHVYTRTIPIVDFFINDTNQCLGGNRFIFRDNSTMPLSPYGGSIAGYIYRFGDVTQSTLANPVHIYTTLFGNFQVTLVVTTTFNCRDSLSKYVVVLPSPVAKFDINDTLQCLTANNFRFENKSTMSPGTITTMAWDFGDSTTGNGSPVTHIYTHVKNFKVKLKVTANNGCFDSLIQTVHVVPKPKPNFICPDTSQCFIGNNFQFTSISPPAMGYVYIWKFGDGQSKTGPVVNHIYTSIGTKNVTLTIISGNCRDSIVKQVIVSLPPNANFSINSARHCLKNNKLIFTNTTVYAGTGTLTYKWLFGDGDSSKFKDTSHIYKAIGTYTVKMYAISLVGCVDSISKTVTIDLNSSPSFIISPDTSQCIFTNLFVFTNTSTGGKPGGGFWIFGDGTFSSVTDPSHTYSSPGTKSINYILVNTAGCSDTFSKKVVVRPKPTAKYSVNDNTQCLGWNNFKFTNTSIVIGLHSNLWAFGDGINSTLTNPEHTYTTSDTFTVRLIVITPGGCIDTTYGTAKVYPTPGSKFSVDDTVKCQSLGRTFQFTNQTPNAVVPHIITFFWDFGEPPATSTLRNPSITYFTSGIFKVMLYSGLEIIKDTLWCYDTAYLTIVAAPAARIIFKNYDSIQCFDRNLFHFTNKSLVTFGSLKYLWNFGDGDTSTAINPTHHYATIDTFQVTLTGTSNYGCIDSFKWHTYLKNGARPVAAFTVNDSIQCLFGNNFGFINNSTISAGNITGYLWSFGDGDTSHKHDISHIYKTDGIKSSKLFIISDAGCTDSVIHPMLVAPKPKVKFTPNDSTQCLNENVFVYNNTTTITLGTFNSFWNFDDGSTSLLKSPTHSFSQIRSYNVKLVAVSDQGCMDSVTHTSLIYPLPVAAFDIKTDTVQCLDGNFFSYVDKSTMSNGTIIANLWRFDDGNSATNTSNPSNSYTTPGTFNVTLVVASDKICYDTANIVVSVYNGPVVDFTVNDSTQCMNGNNFVFTNNSTISSDTLTYLWKFGDGTTSTLINPSHSYTLQDTFNVMLIGYSLHGCNDSLSHNMVVINQATTSFTINDSDQCVNNNFFKFTNTTTPVFPGSVYFWDFGNGDTSTVISPSYIYTSTGTFTVKLKILNSEGCSDSFSKNVYVSLPQQTSFTVNDTNQCLAGNKFIFTNTSSIPVGTLNYLWDFGNNQTSTLTNPAFTFTTAGIHAVKLKTLSSQGCVDSFSKNIFILPAQQTSFTINDTAQCLTGNLFNFTNTSTFPSGTLTYFWDFGNGNTSTSKNISYSYIVKGKYTVKLVSISNINCRDSVIHGVYVGTAPKADFAVNDTSQCLKVNNFVFTNKSTAGSGTIITGYNWYFGDGDTSSATNPTHAFLTADTFTVKLVALTSGGCYDSITKQVYVRPMPKADFSINLNPQNIFGNNFIFTNKSTVPYGNFSSSWDFGNGNNAPATNASQSYSTIDTFSVKLTITSDYGCIDTISKLVYLFSGTPPGITISFIVKNACVGDPVLFINTSTVTLDSFRNFVWNFGDSTQINTLTNPQHIYQDTGTYLVKLRGLTWGGLQDSISLLIKIYEKPTVNISYVPDKVGFFGDKITLTANGTFDALLWSTGEQTTSIIVNKTGNYLVKATNIYDCSAWDSIFIKFTEAVKLESVTIFTPNGDGYNDYFKILNIDLFKPLKVSIYNRWGDELYSSNDYKNNWDGKYKGKVLPEGTYYFIIVDKEGKVHTGATNIVKN